MLLNRKLFLDLDAVRRAAGFFIVKWIKWHRGLSIEEVHQWRRPIGVLSVASLLPCQKKSDLLRLLCCPGAVDSVALMDARLPVYLPKFHYDGEKYVKTAKTRFGDDNDDDDDADPEVAQRAAIDVAAKHRQKFIRKREACMGCGQEDCDQQVCERCGDIYTWLGRDRDFEERLWGPEDEPKVKMNWSS